MSNDKVFAMPFAKVFPLLIAKAEKKGRTRAEVYEVTCWLTGYTAEQLDALLESTADYGTFLKGMPCPNENRSKITGSVCGVKLHEIDDPMMLELRRLDKLVDELAKGKPMDKILRK